MSTSAPAPQLQLGDVGTYAAVQAIQFNDGWVKRHFPETWRTAKLVGRIVSIKRKRQRDLDELVYVLHFHGDNRNYSFADSAVEFVSIDEPDSFRLPVGYVESEPEESEHEYDEDELAQATTLRRSRSAGSRAQSTLEHPVASRTTTTATPTIASPASRTSLNDRRAAPALSQAATSAQDTTPTGAPLEPEVHYRYFDGNPYTDILDDHFCDTDGTPYPRFDAKLLSHHEGFMKPRELLFSFLPMGYIRSEIFAATNTCLRHDGHDHLGPKELVLWLAYLFAMTFFRVSHRDDYWATEGDFLTPAINLGRFGMSRDRFRQIHSCIRFVQHPVEDDQLGLIRPLINAFNENMQVTFSPSYLVCMDESMSKWTSRYSIPCWMYLPRKPTPMGHEYHDIACGQTKIIIALELVESTLLPKDFEEYGKMPATLLRLTRAAGLWSTPRILVGDSAFTSVVGMEQLHQRKIHCIFTVKKKRYWPKDVPGAELQAKTAALTTSGDCISRPGAIKYADGRPPLRFFVSGLKDYHNFLLVSNASSIKRLEATTTRKFVGDNGEPQSSTYHRPDVYNEFFTARHAVDDSNHLRQGTNGIEDTWLTKHWTRRDFGFLLGVAEANAFCAYVHFGQNPDDLDDAPCSHFQFRRLMVRQLLEWCWDRPMERIDFAPSVQHSKRSLPHGQHWNADEETWVNDDHTTRYPQRVCRSCSEQGHRGVRTRFYCVCRPDHPLCADCWAAHKVKYGVQ